MQLRLQQMGQQMEIVKLKGKNWQSDTEERIF